MKPIIPAAPHQHAQLVNFALNQASYAVLPASVDPGGVVMTEWQLSAEDLARVLEDGRVRLWIYTFGQPLQPVLLEVVE